MPYPWDRLNAQKQYDKVAYKQEQGREIDQKKQETHERLVRRREEKQTNRDSNRMPLPFPVPHRETLRLYQGSTAANIFETVIIAQRARDYHASYQRLRTEERKTELAPVRANLQHRYNEEAAYLRFVNPV
jgi:hypothetical protein